MRRRRQRRKAGDGERTPKMPMGKYCKLLARLKTVSEPECKPEAIEVMITKIPIAKPPSSKVRGTIKAIILPKISVG